MVLCECAVHDFSSPSLFALCFSRADLAAFATAVDDDNLKAAVAAATAAEAAQEEDVEVERLSLALAPILKSCVEIEVLDLSSV